MGPFIRSNLRVVVAVLLTAALIGGGPSIAAMVFDARNADKVDGFHAKKYVTKAKKRRKKLVATNKKGYLPNNIIKVAPNAKKLAGIGPTGFWRKTDSVDAALLGGLAVDAFALAAHDHDADYAALDHDHDGDVLLTAAPGAWQTPLTPVALGTSLDPTIAYTPSGISFTKSAVGTQTFSLYPDVPAVLYGKRMTFKGIEICYDSSMPGVTINSATANVVTQDGAGAAAVAPFALFGPATNANCVYTQFVSPVTLDVDKGINVQLTANWTAPAVPLVLGRTTFVFSSTAQDATAPS